jgi:succinyl-CoA synthetase beta subunit
VKLQEADAKSLLVAQGLPVPDWAVAHSADEARTRQPGSWRPGPVGGKVVIKAQVLVGGAARPAA